MKINEVLIVCLLVLNVSAYEKKEIDISYLEKNNLNTEDRVIPANKTGNVTIRTYNRDGLIFIDSIYHGIKEIELALDSGKHLIFEKLGDKIVNDTIMHFDNEFSGKLNLGPKRKELEINAGLGYCRIIMKDEKDLSLPVLNLKGNIICKKNWIIGLSGSINVIDYFKTNYDDTRNLNYKMTEDEKYTEFYSGGFLELHRNFSPSSLINVGVGMKAGVGAFFSKKYTDTLITATFVIRDPEDPYNHSKKTYFEATAFSRLREKEYFFEVGGPSVFIQIGTSRVRFTVNVNGTIGARSRYIYSVNEEPLDEDLEYDYMYFSTSDGDEYENEMLPIILHTQAYISFKF